MEIGGAVHKKSATAAATATHSILTWNKSMVRIHKQLMVGGVMWRLLCTLCIYTNCECVYELIAKRHILLRCIYDSSSRRTDFFFHSITAATTKKLCNFFFKWWWQMKYTHKQLGNNATKKKRSIVYTHLNRQIVIAIVIYFIYGLTFQLI